MYALSLRAVCVGVSGNHGGLAAPGYGPVFRVSDHFPKLSPWFKRCSESLGDHLQWRRGRVGLKVMQLQELVMEGATRILCEQVGEQGLISTEFARLDKKACPVTSFAPRHLLLSPDRALHHSGHVSTRLGASPANSRTPAAAGVRIDCLFQLEITDASSHTCLLARWSLCQPESLPARVSLGVGAAAASLKRQRAHSVMAAWSLNYPVG
ncbi:hypothetical protein B0O80DRAFT_511160 [Mortierella sp. GBAus27b]|nr:hypothetical protein B0O80DRAFT_511160 [Mortierella sp. GBAus27b]